MFQSFSRNNTTHKLQLQCNKCKQKPIHQFILLLCDHVICASCLEEQVEIRQNQYDGIKCPCGVVTYFKTVGDGQPEWDLPEDQVTKKINNISVNIHNTSSNQERASRKASNRASIGLIQSKNTTSTKNFSRIHTEGLGFNQSAGYEPIEQPYANLMLQQSKYPVRNTNMKGNESRVSELSQDIKFPTSKASAMTPQPSRKSKNIPPSAVNFHYCPKFIDSESVTDDQISQKQNLNPNKSHQKSRKIHIQNRQFQQDLSDLSENGQSPEFSGHYSTTKNQRHTLKQQRDTSEHNQLSSQLKSQLKYLKITHEKNLQALERTYKQAKQKINADYSKLENKLKDFCLETLALGQEETQINIGKIMGMRYETYVGSQVEKLTQEIRKYSTERDRIPLNYSPIIRHEVKPINLLSSSNFLERKGRFTSPQPYRSEHLQTEPGGIYPKAQMIRNQSKQIYGCSSNQYQNFRQIPNEASSKLHKRGGRRKTNIIIEL